MKINFKKLSMGQIVDLCIKCKTKKEAKNLLDQYKKFCDKPEYAAVNIGYMMGYYDYKTREKVYSLFEISHPYFGTGFK